MVNVAEGGLVDCKSTEEVDAALKDAMKNWKSLHKNGAKFCGYFFKEKADEIRNCCTADIRSMCGLGFLEKRAQEWSEILWLLFQGKGRWDPKLLYS